MTSPLEANAAADLVISDGTKVQLHYVMRVEGQIVDDSSEGEPMEFIYGKDDVLPGISKAVKGLKEGEKKKITLSPEQGFGYPQKERIQEVPKTEFEDQDFQVGSVYKIQIATGETLPAILSAVKEKTIVLDFNHPLAGYELELSLEIISVTNP